MLPQASVTLTVHSSVVSQPTVEVFVIEALTVLEPKPQDSVTAPTSVIAVLAVGVFSGLQPKSMVLFAVSPSVQSAKVGAVLSIV